MKRFQTYFLLEYKKNLKTLPTMLLGIFFIGMVAAIAIFGMKQQKTANPTTTIGIVANPDEPYLNQVVSLLENMDSIKENYSVSLVSEREGLKKLDSGAFKILLFIPENYVHAMMYCENPAIEVRFGKGDPTISSIMIKQLSDVLSNILIQTEAAIFSLDAYYNAHHLPGRSDNNTKLNIRYIQKILARNTLFHEQELEAEHSLHYEEYYLLVGFLLFVCILGLLAPKAFQRENSAFEQKLAASGFSPFKQLLAKYLACCAYFLLPCFLAIVCISMIAPIFLKENAFFEATSSTEWLLKLLPLLLILPLFIICFQFIHEIITDLAASTLTLFVGILVLGYLSGFFYPFSFLPKLLQQISILFPTRVAFLFGSSCISNNFSLQTFGALCSYTIILYALLLLLRYRRLEVIR